ncbi:hypothetical protein [Xanthomonas oryzae]|uniref:hypothetical protein n=1 Tax=Xanthomonas oryzae TaxID=347 RepID=UPI0018E9CBFF|nr:hypothetical protein [Xanthomonas oryzae]
MTEDNPVDLPIGSINTQFFAQVRNIRKLLQGLIHGSEPELTSVAINNAPEISGVLHAQGVSMPPIRFQDHAHEPRSLQAVAVCIQVSIAQGRSRAAALRPGSHSTVAPFLPSMVWMRSK